MKQVLRTTGNIFYTALVVVVLAFALLFLGTKIDLFGYEVKVVQSGSMEPAIQTGGIVVLAPSATYNVGDIVTFGRDTRNSVPVTHRIVDKTSVEGVTTYMTKGDANEEADNASVTEGAIIGSVVFSVPYVGYVIDFARTPLGFLLLVGLPALVIVLDSFADIMWEIHKYRYKLRKQGKSGKRKGQTGYRTPSRERDPRDFPRQGRPPRSPGRSAPQVRRPGHMASESSSEYVFDLRNYRFKRPSA